MIQPLAGLRNEMKKALDDASRVASVHAKQPAASKIEIVDLPLCLGHREGLFANLIGGVGNQHGLQRRGQKRQVVAAVAGTDR